MMGEHAHPPCVITKGDALEVEIASGAMTRLAGVSEALVGVDGYSSGDRDGAAG